MSSQPLHSGVLVSNEKSIFSTNAISNIILYAIVILLTTVLINVLQQCLPRNKSEPPIVFHWFPIIGSAVSYGKDPYEFFKACREKHGDVFTFVLLGKKMTACLGTNGNDFILNNKLHATSAEEIYGPLTIPVFGSDVVYDVPNAKFMEQKKFIKFGLTQAALDSYVPLIEKETNDYVSSHWSGDSGVFDVGTAMAEITIFTASRALQGREVRSKLTAEFASLYHDLDLGFRPINFVLPWAPLPQNRRRDAAHVKMRQVYLDIIRQRRLSNGNKGKADDTHDMISHLMNNCFYKSGQPITDLEIAHMMITLLMAGQHSSSSASSWIILHLASRPEIADQLYQEQLRNLSHHGFLPPLQYADMDKLPLLQSVIKETLRTNPSIHSILRKVKTPLAIPNTPYTVTPDKVLLAAPIMTGLDDDHFVNARTWNPHRWLGQTDEFETDNPNDEMVDYGYGAVKNKGSKNPYLPFGGGRHRCIGEKFAYVNLGVIIAALVREFRFSTVDGKGNVPATDHTSLFSRPVQPSLVRWERRFKSS